VVEHIVIFKWKEDAPPDKIAEAIAGLKALKDEIPGIISLTCGENFSPRSQGYECGLLVRFVDRAALEAYGPHPAHQAVVQTLISPIRTDTIVVDFEI
jgi:hypothetical protein